MSAFVHLRDRKYIKIFSVRSRCGCIVCNVLKINNISSKANPKVFQSLYYNNICIIWLVTFAYMYMYRNVYHSDTRLIHNCSNYPYFIHRQRDRRRRLMAKGNKSPPCGTRSLRPKTRLKAIGGVWKCSRVGTLLQPTYLEKDGWP